MRINSTLLPTLLIIFFVNNVDAQQVSSLPMNTGQAVAKDTLKPPISEPTKETKTITHSNTQFFYKVGAIKNTVLMVYVSSDFYELFIWEKEQLLQPVFEENQTEHPSINTIALKDAKTGKTVGTFSPKEGVLML